MREILFRGKLKCNGDWSYGNLIVKPNVISLITPDDTPLGRYGEIDPETVGQYTGLTDRNGKKIFEGDIVKQYYKDRLTNVVKFDVGEIVFCEEMGAFIRDRKYGGCGIGASWDYEVIGNIYDNPELRVRQYETDEEREQI